MKVKCYNIDYDTDGIKVKLPKSIVFDIDDKVWEEYGNEVDFLLCDYISDATGWCVNDFNYKPLSMTIGEAIKKATEKYACLQEEDFWIEQTDTYIGLVWHIYMDRFINLHKVKCVANYLRKYTNLPIIDSFGKRY